jgi:hypothetical protein
MLGNTRTGFPPVVSWRILRQLAGNFTMLSEE